MTEQNPYNGQTPSNQPQDPGEQEDGRFQQLPPTPYVPGQDQQAGAPEGASAGQELKKKGKRPLWATVISVLVIAVVVVGVRLGSQLLFHPSKEKQVEKSVEKTKEEIDFPMEVDEVTTWEDITAKGDTAELQYSVHDVDASGITAEQLKQNIAPNMCKDKDIKALLDEGVTAHLVYTLKENDDKVLDFDITQGDCES